MFIVLGDEPGLFVFRSPTEAQRHIEAIDAEDGILAAFDDSAIPYRPEFVIPNRRSKLLFIQGITPGEYYFKPAGPADPDALIALLEKHADHTNPPETRAELHELLLKLRSSMPG